MRPSLLAAHIGQLRFAQIEFPFDPAPRLILQLPLPIQVVDLLPLGGDQQTFNLIV